jgi:hypothetical protein
MLLLQDIVIAIKSVEQKIKVFGLLNFNFILGMSVSMTHNVLALGAVADFGAQNCQYTTKVDAR